MDGIRMNILNEEIRAIKLYMSHLNKAVSLTPPTGEKVAMKKKYDELENILKEKLEQCDDYTG